MANIYCVLLKFCVYCLIFVELSQSKQIKSDRRYHQYDVEDSENQNYLENGVFDSFDSHRVKRDVNVPQTIVATTDASTPTTATSTTPDKVTKTETQTSTAQSAPHSLGKHGHGQRRAPTVVFVPYEAINQTITNHLNANKTEKIDYFKYYNSSTVVDKNKSDEYWATEKAYTISNILSKSHRRAIAVKLHFDFPFYGQIVRNVLIGTGGFLYVGQYVHSSLAATQYIAPLMANFDTSMSNVSTVKYSDNGTAFTVIWDKAPLRYGDPSKLPLFTFSVTLYSNGDITFAYRTIPIAIEMIKDEKYPVKIGVSDAYILDSIINSQQRKTIYEYNRIKISVQNIKNDTLITLKALPTCLEYTDCNACLGAELEAFNCMWCPTLNRCSTGEDGRRQEWINAGCDQSQLHDAETCPALGTEDNSSESHDQE